MAPTVAPMASPPTTAAAAGAASAADAAASAMVTARHPAARLHGVKDVRVDALEVPPPSAGFVQIAIQAVGICGSDLQYWRDGVAGGVLDIDFAASLTDPTGYRGVLGHEAAGIVTAVGPAPGGSSVDASSWTKLRVGDRVALEAGVQCGSCVECRRGRYNLCSKVAFLGSYVNRQQGALCRAFNHPASHCFRLPDSVSFTQGAMLEPLCVALSAIRRAQVDVGHTVIVTGCGPVGLLCMMVAKTAGASRVVMTDTVDAKLALAKRLGADRVMSPLRVDDDEDAGAGAGDTADAAAGAGVGAGVGAGAKAAADLTFDERLMRWITDGSGDRSDLADVAIECSGAPSALSSCVYCTRPGGSLCIVANQHSKQTTVPLQEICRREIEMRGVFRYANAYPAALRLVASGQIDVEALVTHTFPLDEASKAFEVLGSGEATKAIINVQEGACEGWDAADA